MRSEAVLWMAVRVEVYFEAFGMVEGVVELS